MNAQLRRKNNGKQFALVHVASRFIFDWYRPGDALPKVVSSGGKFYLLDKTTVEAAKVVQRVALKEVNFQVANGEDWTVQDVEPGKCYALVEADYNQKGTVYSTLRDTKWDRLKNVGAWAGMGIAAVASAGLILNHVKDYL